MKLRCSLTLSLTLMSVVLQVDAAPKKTVSALVTKKTPNYQVQIEVDIKGAKQLFLEVADGGDGSGYDWADWMEPRLISADGTEKRLTDLKWKTNSASGRSLVGKNQGGGPLMVNGKAVAYGIGTHAECKISYDLPPGYVLFRAGGGLDDGGVGQAGSRPSVEFRAYTDPRASFISALNVSLPEGFVAEALYHGNLATEGSWVALCVDGKGRLITSDRQGPLYRITLSRDEKKEVVVERLPVEVGRANGLLEAFGSLYVMGIGSGKLKGKSGLFRLTDTNKDDRYDKVEHLMKVQVGSDHHGHAIILSPDGKRLVMLCGNSTDLPDTLVARNILAQKEDHLLPRSTYYGHNTNRMAPGGFVVTCLPDGSDQRAHCAGFRNPYDIAFNNQGDLFTFDADMEYDVGGPWYRPTRVNHCVSGGEYGWRFGAGKWPDWYPDTAGTTVDIGRGSPTGVVFGYGAKFPAKYQKALYVLDWTYGKIYAVHLSPEGATYSGEFETFVSGRGLPVSDIVIHPDGAMYFVTGGRRSKSVLVRVTYSGSESTAPIATATSPTPEGALRRELEALHVGPAGDGVQTVERIWPSLMHKDRAVRYAARVALEHQPVALWEKAAALDSEPRTAIETAVALARMGEKKHQAGLERNLAKVDFAALKREQKLDLLRAYGLIFIRLGAPGTATRSNLIKRLSPHYPSGDIALDRELCQMLLYLDAPGAVARSVEKLLTTNTQGGQMFYAYHLRTIADGWSDDDLRAYFGWIQHAQSNGGDYTGGGHFSNFLKMIRKEALARLSDVQKKAITAQLASKPREKPSVLEGRVLVKDWKLPDLKSALSRVETQRSFIRGKTLYTGLCATCHLFNGKGGAIGPDLSSVGGRYDYPTLLTEIIEPSKVISDQHAAVTLKLKDGSTVFGREVGGDDDILNMAVNPLKPEEIRKIKKSEIAEREVSKISMMPPGMLNTLNEEEILDVIMYLSSGGNVAHTAFQK